MAQAISFLATLAVNVAIGVALFFGLIVILNGFSERDATWGIYLYIAAGIAASLLIATLAAVATGVLVRRGTGAALSGLIAIGGFSFVGGIIKVGLVFAGVIAAEVARNSR